MSEFKMYFIITVRSSESPTMQPNALLLLYMRFWQTSRWFCSRGNPWRSESTHIAPMKLFSPTVGYNLTCWIYQILPEFLKTAYLVYIKLKTFTVFLIKWLPREKKREKSTQPHDFARLPWKNTKSLSLHEWQTLCTLHLHLLQCQRL